MSDDTFLDYIDFVLDENQLKDLDLTLDQAAESRGDDSSRDPIVAFIGTTGAGKSTAINFLAGCSSELNVTKLSRTVKQVDPKAATSNDRVSCTMVASSYGILEERAVAIDMPGSFDTGGQSVSIFQAYGVAATLRRVGRLDAIVFVTAAHEANDEKATSVRLQLPFISTLRSMFPAAAAVLAVTKIDKLVDADDLETLKEIEQKGREVYKPYLTGSPTAEEEVHVIFVDYRAPDRVKEAMRNFYSRRSKRAAPTKAERALPRRR